VHSWCLHCINILSHGSKTLLVIGHGKLDIGMWTMDRILILELSIGATSRDNNQDKVASLEFQRHFLKMTVFHERILSFTWSCRMQQWVSESYRCVRLLFSGSFLVECYKSLLSQELIGTSCVTSNEHEMLFMKNISILSSVLFGSLALSTSYAIWLSSFVEIMKPTKWWMSFKAWIYTYACFKNYNHNIILHAHGFVGWPLPSLTPQWRMIFSTNSELLWENCTSCPSDCCHLILTNITIT